MCLLHLQRQHAESDVLVVQLTHRELQRWCLCVHCRADVVIDGAAARFLRPTSAGHCPNCKCAGRETGAGCPIRSMRDLLPGGANTFQASCPASSAYAGLADTPRVDCLCVGWQVWEQDQPRQGSADLDALHCRAIVTLSVSPAPKPGPCFSAHRHLQALHWPATGVPAAT